MPLEAVVTEAKLSAKNLPLDDSFSVNYPPYLMSKAGG